MTATNDDAARRGQPGSGVGTEERTSQKYHDFKELATTAESGFPERAPESAAQSRTEVTSPMPSLHESDERATSTHYAGLVRDICGAAIRAGGYVEAKRRLELLRLEVDLATGALNRAQKCLDGKLVGL